jgi:two-component system chemotaxis sensor kinase CheA
MESCLRALRQRELALSPSMFEALVEGVRLLEQTIAARRSRAEQPSIASVLRRLADVSRPSDTDAVFLGSAASDVAPAPSSGALWKVTFTPSPELVARGIKVDVIRGRLSAIGQVQSVTPRVTAESGISFDFQVAAEDGVAFEAWKDDGVEATRLTSESADDRLASSESAAVAAPRPGPVVAPSNFVRVDLKRLDDLMRLVGELVVSRARLEDALLRVEAYTPSAEWRALQEHSESIERHLRDLREGVMRVRLVPVGEIFRRMPFVVRDLSRDNGKRIQLELTGQSTEIDKFLIERMMDPILHLVRNAISHGIEVPEERVARAKRPDGTIRLSASTVGESAMLEVSDDGRGMDGEAIARRARERGIELGDGPLDARGLLDVICSPGFSTRDSADRASGRGVGMSVVRDAIQELGGTLSLDTTLEQGTTFRIVLPLTLAITDALIVHVGDRVFAIPQSAVREVTDVDPSTIRVLENNELITHRGMALPIVRLGRLFAIDEAPRPRRHVIIIGTESAAVGLMVDRISGQREVVVKTLADPLIRVAGISGATELGDGRLVLILEPTALTRKLRGWAPARAAG